MVASWVALSSLMDKIDPRTLGPDDMLRVEEQELSVSSIDTLSVRLPFRYRDFVAATAIVVPSGSGT